MNYFRRVSILILLLLLSDAPALAYNDIQPISKGGTGATTAAIARSNLALAIGVNVEAWSAALDTLAGKFLQGNGTKIQLSTGTTTTGHGAIFDANGNVIDGGVAPATGTVTSAALTGDGFLFNSSVTGSPITTAGSFVPSLASHTANTVIGALTATTPSDLAVPSCSTASSALKWTSGTGFGCNSSIAASSVTGETFPASGLIVGPTDTQTLTNKSIAGSEVNSGTIPAAQLPNPTASTLGGVESLASVAHNFLTSISTSGVPTQAQPSCGDLSNAAASCSTDSTNASNITSGTLGAARLPNPSATTLGGIESLVPTSHQWINTISTSGVPSSTQPACADLSNAATSCSTDTTNASNINAGTLGAGRLPLPGAASLGGVFSKAAVSHNFLTSISSVDGSIGQSQPGFADLSGSVASTQMPALTGDTTTSAGATTTTTSKVNGVSYGTSPSTNTVPVVTGTNATTYETVPNAALANSSLTVAGHSISLGGTQAIACGDLSNAAASCSTDTTNATNINSGILATAQLPAFQNYATTASIMSISGGL